MTSDPPPRSMREQLIFKALLVLDDAVDACSPTPVKPNYGLRLALALLYVLGDGEREAFDMFWKIVVADNGAITAGMKADVRTTYARTYLTKICRNVGMPLSVGLMTELNRTRIVPSYERRRRQIDQAIVSSDQPGEDRP